FALNNGVVTVEDTGSTNGVYVNGERISGRRQVQLSDVIQIGPFVLQGDTSQGVAVYDTRSKTRIDGINIVKMVPNRAGGGTIKLLDDIGLTIQPNEFVGLLGPSGAGKSTLMDALNGMRPASSGFVLINNLDPATEEKIMKLFRQIAESGRTVILTTHAMENVKLFDKIVVLMRGKLVFYGAPQEALSHVKAESFKDLYDKLEAPVDQQIATIPPPPPNASKAQQRAFKQQREQIAEQVADDWKRKFQNPDTYRRNVLEPLSVLPRDGRAPAPPKRRATAVDVVRQWGTLTRRYLEVLSRDKFNLLILFGQAPIIAFLTYLVVGAKSPRDFPYFVLGLVALWFGTSGASREIIRERAVYARE